MKQAAISFLRDYGWILFCLGLLLGVTFLPPDTSLQQIRKYGVISVCVPPLPMPAAGSAAETTNFERELMSAITRKLGLRLVFYDVAAMVQNFDPRDWGVNRSQCSIMAAGIADNSLTRAFMDVSPPYGAIGLVGLAMMAHEEISGLNIAVPVNLKGVDRLALSQYLRREKAKVRLVDDSAGALALLRELQVDAAIIPARDTNGQEDWKTVELPASFSSHPLVFGLWKGDLTLKRAFSKALLALEADGTVEAMRKSLESPRKEATD